jgi:glycosyltransferase involved in cell wall biosynthesis
VRAAKRLVAGPPRPVPFSVPESNGFYEKLGTDVFHVTYPYHYVRTKIPTIYTIHDLQHKHLSQLFSPRELEFRERLYQAAFDESKYVIAVSHFTRWDVVRHHGISPAKIYTIHWAPPTRLVPPQGADAFERVRRRLRLPESYVIFPSLTYAHKNHLALLEALSLLRRRHGLKLNVVCPGYRSLVWPQIKERIKELDLGQQICFPGYLPETDLLALLRGASFMVFPSLFEGAGLPALEAISEGIPLTCSDIPALCEYIGPAALYFDPRSVESIANAMREMHSSPELQGELRRRGSEQAAKFTWERTARAHLALYRMAAGLSLAEDEKALLRECQREERRHCNGAPLPHRIGADR